MMNSGLRRLLSGAVALMLLGCSSALADTATVTARKLILREKASSTSDALQTLPKGTKLEVLGKSGSWYKVTYGKYTGYVYKTYVSVTKTASSSSSSSSATRLEKGSTGSDVKDLQTKLKKLGYYDAYVDGDYGDTTVAAVKAFQKKYNLTADGIAGKETLKKLDSAYKNADSDKDDDSLRMGDSGSAVKDLQTKLKKLGYYSGTVDSTFGSGTYAAVRAFQKKYNLTADGVAGSATLKKIESAVASASSGKITTEQLDWFNGGKNVIPNGAVFQIKDVSTGLIFSARRQSGGNHMDAEPLTAEDTAILKKINGGTFSWRRRAVLVKYNGHVYAASIYSEPHGTNTILDNNFDGQFCLHFYGSKTHGTDRVDADHQKCVEQAMKATW